jgi:DNA repair protein SbcC/Rad50
MLISRVELENVKNYEEGTFEFGPGVTAICGPNGAGKTTILEAISWALFDHLPYKKDDFLRRGAKKGSVRVTFESAIDQREYTVYRDTGTGYYVYDPITKLKVVEQKSQVGAWIKQHLGVDAGTDLKTLFTSTIGVPQGTFTVDFADQPARRKISFDKVLRVDEYQRSSEELRSLVRLLEVRDVELREEIARTGAEVESLDGLLAEHAEFELALERLQKELEETERELELVRARAQRLDELLALVERLGRESAGLLERVEDLDRRRAVIAEEVELSRKAAERVAASEQGYATYNEAKSQLEGLEGRAVERDALKQEYSEAERDQFRAEASLQSAREKLAQIDADRREQERLAPLVEEQGQMEARRAELQTLTGELKGLAERARAADRDLKTFRAEYAELMKHIEEAEGAREDAERASELEEQRRKLEAGLTAMRVALTRLADRKAEQKQSQEKIRKLDAEIKTLEKDIERGLAAEDLAAGIPKLEADDQAVLEEVLALKESIRREEKIIAGIKGGLCPLLSERCLNMKEGQGLDQFFKSQVGGERERLTNLERQRKGTQVALADAKAALKTASAVASWRVQHFRFQQDLEIERAGAARLRSEIDQTAVSEKGVQQAEERLQSVEALLRRAQEAKVKYEGLGRLRERQDRLKIEGTAKKTECEQLNARIVEMAGLDDELIGVDDRLRVLDDPRGRSRSLALSLEREADVRGAIQSLEDREKSISAALALLAERLDEFKGLDDQIAVERARRAASEKDYQAYINNQPIAALLGAREAELGGLDTEIAETRSQLSTVESSLQAARSEYDPDAHAQARGMIETLINKAATLSSEANTARSRISYLKSEIEGLLAVKQKMQELLASKDRCGQILSLSDFIRDVLKKAAPYITEAHLQSISIEANQLYREITGNPMVSVRWESGYEVVLEEDGHERSFANLSGGEQMAAALSVRLALLKELSEMRVAFFDEPTTNMDEERRRNLAQQIGRIKDFDQLFVISHDDAFEGFTDRVVTVRGPSTGA